MKQYSGKRLIAVIIFTLFSSCMTFGPEDYQAMQYDYLAKHVQECQTGSQSSMIDCETAEDIYNRRTQTVTLSHPGMRDPSVEKGFKNAVVRAGFPGVPVQSVIISDHWTYKREPGTGALIGRELMGDVAMQESNNTCYFLTLSFSQNYDGSQYEDFFISRRSVKQRILCKNIK